MSANVPDVGLDCFADPITYTGAVLVVNTSRVRETAADNAYIFTVTVSCCS